MGRLRKLHRPVEIVVVRECERRITELQRSIDQLIGAAGTLPQRPARVRMKLNVGGWIDRSHATTLEQMF